MTITGPDTLRDLIREFGAADPNPHRVAEKILSALTDDEARVIARVTLGDYARRVLALPRTGQVPNTGARFFETASGELTVSARTAAHIDYVAAELGRSLYIGSENDYKVFGDCSAQNCRELALFRRKKAAEVAAEADRFDRVAAAVEDAGVDMVKELPRGTLEEVLRR